MLCGSLAFSLPRNTEHIVLLTPIAALFEVPSGTALGRTQAPPPKFAESAAILLEPRPCGLALASVALTR